MKSKKNEYHKPVIDTIINTAAIGLTSWGVVQITSSNWEGYLAILFSMGLELLKYWARKIRLW